MKKISAVFLLTTAMQFGYASEHAITQNNEQEKIDTTSASIISLPDEAVKSDPIAIDAKESEPTPFEIIKAIVQGRIAYNESLLDILKDTTKSAQDRMSEYTLTTGFISNRANLVTQ